MRYEIQHTARKHGIDDDEILHTIQHALVVRDYGDNRTLYLGPDRAANLLEVVAILLDVAEVELVIHAMPMRPKYQPLLRGLGDPDA
mgnify:CR=1 FL=1|jgi:hypothetical protein